MKILQSYIQFAENVSEKSGQYVSWFTTAMMIVVVFDVITRYFFKNSSVAIQELEWHFFAIIFLLGAAYTLKHDRHVRVDVLYIRLTSEKQAWINLLGSILFLLPFCLLIIWSSTTFVSNSFQFMESSPDPGGLPARFILKACIPLGFILVLIQGVADIFKSMLIIRGETLESEVAIDD